MLPCCIGLFSCNSLVFISSAKYNESGVQIPTVALCGIIKGGSDVISEK